MSDILNLTSKIKELREIINSSICYKQSTWDKKDEGNWSKLWCSLDNIEDAQLAIDEYKESLSISRLSVYGVLQALVVQQDAVIHVEESIGIAIPKFEDYPGLKEIRDLRNETIGHPSETKRRKSSLYKEGEVTYTSINLRDFNNILEYIIWSNMGTTKKEVNIKDVIVNQQEMLLSREVDRIMTKIQQDENEHIKKFQNDSIVKKLAQSGYFIQKLWPYEHDRSYSQSCLDLLTKVYEDFKNGVSLRYGIENLSEFGVQIPGLILVVQKVDNLLPRIKEMILMGDDVDSFNLEVYVESLDNAFLKLRDMAEEIDNHFQYSN